MNLFVTEINLRLGKKRLVVAENALHQGIHLTVYPSQKEYVSCQLYRKAKLCKIKMP